MIQGIAQKPGLNVEVRKLEASGTDEGQSLRPKEVKKVLAKQTLVKGRVPSTSNLLPTVAKKEPQSNLATEPDLLADSQPPALEEIQVDSKKMLL